MTVTTDQTAIDSATGEPIAQVRRLADTNRRAIEAEWAQQGSEERETACAAAHERVQQDFPATLAKVVGQDAWTGYPALHGHYGAETVPSAVAYLGEGVWLFFEVCPGSGGLLRLLAPCPCGTYLQLEPWDDYWLAGQLDVLPAVTGCTGHP